MIEVNDVKTTVMNNKNYSTLPVSLSSTSSNESNQECSQSSYMTSSLPLELFAAVMIYIGGIYIPKLIIKPYFGVNMRPIPFQILQNSKDVVLDLGLNNPLIEDVTMSSALLRMSSFYLPLLILVLVTYISPKTKLTNKYHDIHSAICVYLTTIGVSEFITHATKYYVGRLRPNFYALCGFNLSSLSCTNSLEMELKGRCSFPSGHSSFSTSEMGVLAMFFLGRVGIMTTAGLNNKNTKFYAFLSLMPLAYSTFCGSSRLYDNWHHPSDVVAGICLGIFCSITVYHLWYAPIFSKHAGTPLSHLASLNDVND